MNELKRVEDYLKSQNGDVSFTFKYDSSRACFVTVVDRGKRGQITRVGNEIAVAIHNTLLVEDKPKPVVKPVFTLPG